MGSQGCLNSADAYKFLFRLNADQQVKSLCNVNVEHGDYEIKETIANDTLL